MEGKEEKKNRKEVFLQITQYVNVYWCLRYTVEQHKTKKSCPYVTHSDLFYCGYGKETSKKFIISLEISCYLKLCIFPLWLY